MAPAGPDSVDGVAVRALEVELARLDPSAAGIAGAGERRGGLLPGGRHTSHCQAVRR